MANELGVQTEIKQSVIAQGGYAVKLSNRFTIGIPDLGIWLGPFAPFIMEVKDFGLVVEGFNRQIGTTPKQRDTMRRMQQSYGKDIWGEDVCGVAVHYSLGGRRFLGMVRWDAETFCGDTGEAVIERQRSGLKWDIYHLLDRFGAKR